MNALEMISNSSMKTEAPKFEIGDTVRVHVKIRKAIRAVFRFLRVLLSQRSTAV